MMNSAFKIRTSILDLHQQEESSGFHQEEKQSIWPNQQRKCIIDKIKYQPIQALGEFYIYLAIYLSIYLSIYLYTYFLQ